MREAGQGPDLSLNASSDRRQPSTVSQLPPTLVGAAVLHSAFELPALVGRLILQSFFHRLPAVLLFFEELFPLLR